MNNNNNRRIRFGDIVLVCVLYGIGSEAFNKKIGVVFAVAAVLFIVFTTSGRQNSKGQNAAGKKAAGSHYRVIRGDKEDERIDRLYRMYSSIIDQYHSTPLPLFSQELGKSRKEVLMDLNTLITSGRFQRPHIEYDENAFVVDEYQKVRGSEEEHSEFITLIAEKKKAAAALTAETAALAQTEEMRGVIESIGRSISDILDKTAASPDLAENDTRRFLNFYLPKSMQCLQNYQKLLQISSPSGEEQTAKEETESALRTIADSFERLLKSLSNEDVFEMSAQAQALKQMLDSEGL
jgi:phage terminase Nu1 subunit (DNA packaging protein)